MTEPKPEQLALVREAQIARSRVIEAAQSALEECEASNLVPAKTCTLGPTDATPTRHR